MPLKIMYLKLVSNNQISNRKLLSSDEKNVRKLYENNLQRKTHYNNWVEKI